jgi:hypothetical protein
MITNIMQKPISACLGHHTSFKNLYSILTSGIGKDQEICFWAFSNIPQPKSKKCGRFVFFFGGKSK